MAKYIDGFVLVVPKGKEDDYRKMAEEGRDSHFIFWRMVLLSGVGAWHGGRTILFTKTLHLAHTTHSHFFFR